MADTKIDVRGTPFLDDNGNLYYSMGINEETDRIKYRLQLFLTSSGANKYHLKSNMPALRPDLGGQPYFLVNNINITPPEKGDKRFAIFFLCKVYKVIFNLSLIYLIYQNGM